jgi:hypothetical protein
VTCLPGLLEYGSMGGSWRVAPGIMLSSIGGSGDGVLAALVPLADDIVGTEVLSDMTSCALAGSGVPVAEDGEPAAVEPKDFCSTAGMSEITAVMSLAAAPFELAIGGTVAGLVAVSGGFSEVLDVDG